MHKQIRKEEVIFMNYIPSQYSYDDVLNILDKEKKNSDISRINPAVIV